MCSPEHSYTVDRYLLQLASVWIAQYLPKPIQNTLHESVFNPITEYQICRDIQSEHNYTTLSSSIKRINYMFRPLLDHHQVVLNLQYNCTIQSVYTIGDEIRNDCTKQQTTLNNYFNFTSKIKKKLTYLPTQEGSQPQVQNHCPDNLYKLRSTSLPRTAGRRKCFIRVFIT